MWSKIWKFGKKRKFGKKSENLGKKIGNLEKKLANWKKLKKFGKNWKNLEFREKIENFEKRQEICKTIWNKFENLEKNLEILEKKLKVWRKIGNMDEIGKLDKNLEI